MSDTVAGHEQTPNTNFGFAIDVDGVLSKKTPLPHAMETLQLLHSQGIPYCILTNSGGVKDEDRAMALSKQFNVPMSPEMVVQSHTPFLEVAGQYKGKCILALGGIANKVREVARSYGFDHVVTSSDILTSVPNVWPFAEATEAYHRANMQPLPMGPDGSPMPISAIFIFAAPRDWGLDLQLIHDLLLSQGGRLGTRSAFNGNTTLPNNGFQQDGQPNIFFCNPDLEWATRYCEPRFAQGTFKSALEGIWASDKPLGTRIINIYQCGKPTTESYTCAERRLTLLQMKDGRGEPLQRVYMIGDNPASDIQGANNYKSPRGIAWYSLLVATGVWEKGTTPEFTPTHSLDNVQDAVNFVLEREKYIIRE